MRDHGSRVLHRVLYCQRFSDSCVDVNIVIARIDPSHRWRDGWSSIGAGGVQVPARLDPRARDTLTAPIFKEGERRDAPRRLRKSSDGIAFSAGSTPTDRRNDGDPLSWRLYEGVIPSTTKYVPEMAGWAHIPSGLKDSNSRSSMDLQQAGQTMEIPEVRGCGRTKMKALRFEESPLERTDDPRSSRRRSKNIGETVKPEKELPDRGLKPDRCGRRLRDVDARRSPFTRFYSVPGRRLVIARKYDASAMVQPNAAVRTCAGQSETCA